LLLHVVREALELVARREPVGRPIGLDRATTDAFVTIAGLKLGTERLPDAGVEIAPARHLRAKLDDAAVEGVDGRALIVDLLLEGPGFDGELPELHPVP